MFEIVPNERGRLIVRFGASKRVSGSGFADRLDIGGRKPNQPLGESINVAFYRDPARYLWSRRSLFG